MRTTARPSGPRWTIGPVHHESTNGTDRIVADVGGTPMWFESSDARLAPNPEAFAGAVMLPALQQGATVSTESRLDPVWLDGTARLPSTYTMWWEYPTFYPFEHAGEAPAAESRAPGVASCFTGGVDSFHTLLLGTQPTDHLLFVHGFDIRLDDHARMAPFERMFRKVGCERGKRPIVVRTNLREHPIFATVNWERTHGAALAAAAGVLSPSIGTLIVPSSYRYVVLRPWGSHPGTDPMWSTSRTSIVHEQALYSREDKIGRIADSPIVWNHLRVCWENRVPTGNCSSCQKCLRTMTGISGFGPLERFTVFDHSISLSDRLNALPSIPEHLIQVWGNLLELDLRPDVRTAVEAVLARSHPGFGPRVARYLNRITNRKRHD